MSVRRLTEGEAEVPKEIIGPTDRELLITRVFDAPRELVFEAFTRPEHLMKWWGPHGCTVISCESDPKAGGIWRISMRSPRVLPQFTNRYPINSGAIRVTSQRRDSGGDAAHDPEWIVEKQRGVYQEVLKPERLVFTYEFENDARRPLYQTVVTINFTEEGSRTRLTLHQALFESVSARDDHVVGWGEALEHFAAYLRELQQGQN
jgi:uncharacterized protein YndB with AHSA1/START domain